ncbi:MAG: 4Fe-4S dicluster domain-containing protein, partial [Thermoguttaceae bacterium]|nr:4Fe-4S dicluster domain-containing protein [Thermoguttaceae bacterium]
MSRYENRNPACRRCIEACPAAALDEEGLDARRCLSYLTIEHRGALPEGVTLPDNFYGCDRCQLACPH